jgi:myo-inositol 2-dehydrogenase/D-chiro-inositol 1-dehydrogenase
MTIGEGVVDLGVVGLGVFGLGVIGFGVVGAGVMGADHARTIATSVSGARLVAVADADENRARAVASANGADRSFGDPAALIADETVDAVLVASPDATHVDLVLACLAAGKPVLCEKPLAPDVKGCRKVLAAETALGRRLIQVGFMRRFDPGYVAMKKELATGRLGAPVMMHCVHRNASAPPWFDDVMVVTNSAVHEIDIARFVLDDEIAAATLFVRPERGARDRQFMVLETRGGLIVDVEVFVNAGYGYDVRAEISCEAGSISLRPQAPVETRATLHDGIALAEDWRLHFAAAYRNQLQAFAGFVRTGVAVGASAYDGYAATAIASACLDALKSGTRTPVKLDERAPFYA